MLECRTQGDAHVVKVTVPQLNSTVASTFRTEVLAAVKDGAGPVVLSLDAVEFVDSSGVGAMVAILKALETAPASYTVAVRQSSVLFVIVLGVLQLRENGRTRILGAAATVVGVGLIALWGGP